MEQQVDAALVQAVQAESSEHVTRPRVRRGPRPPEHRSAIEPDEGDLILGYFALAAAMVSQAELDVRHRCLPSCLTKDDCGRRRLSARRFLNEMRAGRASIWSDWSALAEARVR